MNKPSVSTSPHALMLLSSHCVHCPNVLDSLTKMIKSGDIGSFEAINLEEHPEAMQTYKVRSVPWVKIGQHELTGAQTIDALKQRAQWAKIDLEKATDKDNVANSNTVKGNTNNQIADFDFLLSDGQVNKVIRILQKDESGFTSIMSLLSDAGSVLSTRIGIGVVFEEFAGTDIIKSLIPELGQLANKSTDIRIRADALHYLGMTEDRSAMELLQNYKVIKDDDNEIREIIADSLEELTDTVNT